MDSAWEVFVSSLDPAQLEAERMRAPKLSERFGSWEHHRMVHAHKARRLEYRRLESFRVVPLRAVMPVSGAVRQSDGRTTATAGTNTSTTVNPATGLVASNEETNERRAA